MMLFGLDDEIKPTGDLRADLLTALDASRQRLADERTRHLLAVLMDRSTFTGEFKVVKADLTARHTENLRRVLMQACASGDVRPDLDIEESIDLLIGPVVYRALLSPMPLSVQFVEAIVDKFLACNGGANSPPTRRRRAPKTAE